MRLVMHDTHALHGVDIGNWAIIFKTNHMANADFVHRNIAVTVSDRDHRFDLTGQGDSFIVTTATDRMFQRHVLNNTD